VLSGGSYQWSGRLRDKTGREITLASGSGNLPTGVSNIQLVFDGSAIGSNGVDGPYYVTDLLLFGVGNSLSVANVMTTSVFLASAFEGYVTSLGPPRVTGQVKGIAAQGGQQYSVNLQVKNTGVGPARNIFIDELTLRILAGATSTPITLITPILPISVGDLSAGSSTNLTLTLTVPAGVTRFSLSESGTVVDGTGKTLGFSMSQAAVVPQS
jgi:hypothetical protein